MVANTYPDQQAGFDEVIAASEAMQQVLDQARRAARVESTVLLSGEPGTGKRFVAGAIHARSRRAAGPLVALETEAVPPAAVEGELFGQPGAVPEQTGAFQAAAGGTLFLDEVTNLDRLAQARLLYVLEHRQLSPFGGDRPREVDVRLIAATTRDLKELVAAGRFREDLFYRLNVISIHVPPLRQRREDIPYLVDQHLDLLAQGTDMRRVHPSAELLRALQMYDWPGNVRQLHNCLESMVAMADTDILTLEHLPDDFRGLVGRSVRGPAGPPSDTLASLERKAVLKALREHGGNRSRTATSLGISVRTLQRKLKRWQDVAEEA